MPQCCRCNGSGRCKGCECARKNTPCSSCTPSRNGKCANQPLDRTDATACVTVTDSVPADSSSPPNPTTCSVCITKHDDSHNEKGASNENTDESNHDSPTTVFPPFIPAANPTFTWGDYNAPIKLCTVFLDPKGLSPFLACRLIALNKNPGVRPIGICETSRRIVAKAVLSVTCQDILQAAGSLQLCAGQVAGIDAAIHTMSHLFNDDASEAVLLVDANNAFNLLAALQNIRHLCPSISTILINTYREHTDLYVDGTTILSQEGTTQADPLAMPMYALAILPLIHHVNHDIDQVWYADDATATGKITNLRT